MSPQGLFPHSGPRTHASYAEISFYRALKRHLPEGWAAWHSMRVRAPRGRETEGDFILAVPGRGVIIVEVKGGQIEVEDGIWRQNGREMAESPRKQAHHVKEALLQQLGSRHLDKKLPYFAIATAFPDIEWENPPSQGDLEGAVLGAQDLLFLRDALEALVERLFRPIPAPDWPWEAALHELWGESWLPSITLGARTRMAETKLVELDREQRKVLNFIDDNERAYVTGPPGTGKTLLALELAKRWRRRGRKPLYLCFTRGLAASLRGRGDEAFTVREFALKILLDAGVVIEDGKPEALFSQETWNAISERAVEYLPRVRLDHDAIILDEAQDFADGDFALVRALDRGGVLWAFGDEGQGFWKERRNIPSDMRPFVCRLKERYRSPKLLTSFADRYRHDAPEESEPLSPSHELSLLVVPDDSVELAASLSIEKLVEEGVSLSDIAVLSLAGQTRTTLGVASTIGAYEAVRVDDTRADERLIADTFLRYKGLERPWIIVTELGMGTASYDVRMHIALTRATVGCIIVATKGDLDRDPRLRDWCERAG